MAETIAAIPTARNDAVARLRAGDVSNVAVVQGGAPNVESLKDSLLDVGDLVRMFEEAEEATYTARQDAERDRDYYDNKQLTAAEIAVLNKRGQPPVIINRIKRKIDYLVGLEKQQRIDPKALPRTPQHEQDADGATQALRYVAESEDYDNKRSGIWRNILVEGSGGIAVAVEFNEQGEPTIKLRRYAWDRMFADPHSSESDYSDAGYLGGVVWMDYDDATNQYGEEPGAQEALDTTLATAPSETYDDKPKWSAWADKKRKRVRVVQIWLKRDEQWHFAEFTKGGILKAGPSPYVTDKGESDCELIFQSAYVNRDNERYGVVREMISPQDEVNKRRSKALHLLNTHQTMYEDGAVADIEAFRREKAKPDGTMLLNPGALSEKRIISETRTDLAEAQFKLLQESKNEIDLMGPNATQMGDKAQGSASASGKAIIASQQGGMIEMGDLLDNLRHLDKRVFRAIWSRIRQFWTAEKWIRVTDDERNVKWVGMNVDPAQMQMQMQQNPEMQEKIAGVVANVAELDCDIIIDEAPDSVTPALEQWQALVELKKVDAKGELPYKLLIESAPNLKNKDKILAMMEGQGQPDPAQQMQQQLMMAGAQAKVHLDESGANLKDAQTQLTLIEARLKPLEAQHRAGMEEANLQHQAEKEMAGMEHEAGMSERSREHETGLARMNVAQKAHSDQMRRGSGPSVRPS